MFPQITRALKGAVLCDISVKEKGQNSIDYIEYIRIYESIVIEFFLRLKIHIICADVPRFDIENLNFIVSMAKP